MGGGKIIKDATALPEDVASGKVFYNNAGRQVGTFSMEDATATPADVASGKTFYTGAGKEIGTDDSLKLKKYVYTIPIGTYPITDKRTAPCIVINNYSNGNTHNVETDLNSKVTSIGISHKYVHGLEKVCGIKLNSFSMVLFNNLYVPKRPLVVQYRKWCDDGYNDDLEFYCSESSVFVGCGNDTASNVKYNKSMTIEIYTMEV